MGTGADGWGEGEGVGAVRGLVSCYLAGRWVCFEGWGNGGNLGWDSRLGSWSGKSCLRTFGNTAVFIKMKGTDPAKHV